LDSVENLAQRYRATVLVNALIRTFALLLGALAYRQARRAARLDAENRHQAKVRELERQVQHSDRLASIGRLAAGIAHEINNPLAGMSNYLSLLKEDLQSGKSAEAPKLVERVQEGLDRAAGIVRQVLSFADPGKSPRLEVDLHEILVRTVEFVRSNPQFRHLDLQIDSNNGRPISLPGNPTTLNQLFLNLVLNACHAQPEKGRVDVRAAIEAGSRSAVVTVEDRGPGFSEEVLHRLFEPFYSTRGSTGLGLAICHGIVGEHGGKIRAENRPDGGARFIVELPLEGKP
jgi:signal transduction histidine kinase